jgi:hypothetical protein
MIYTTEVRENITLQLQVVIRGAVAIMSATGPKVREFKLGQERQIF